MSLNSITLVDVDEPNPRYLNGALSSPNLEILDQSPQEETYFEGIVGPEPGSSAGTNAR
jgi:hypothetical protein